MICVTLDANLNGIKWEGHLPLVLAKLIFKNLNLLVWLFGIASVIYSCNSAARDLSESASLFIY
jgi:hypothetical protein